MCPSLIRCLQDARKSHWVKHEQLSGPHSVGQELVQVLKHFISPLIEESEALDLKNALALKES